jgi:hypothetical protein
VPPARTAARLRSVPAVPVPAGHAVLPLQALEDAQTSKRLARRCQVLFVGADPDAANDLRGRVQLSRLSNPSGTVLRPGVCAIPISVSDFSQRQCGRMVSRWGPACWTKLPRRTTPLNAEKRNTVLCRRSTGERRVR